MVAAKNRRQFRETDFGLATEYKNIHEHIIARNREIAYNSRMSFRSWLSIVTFVLIAAVLFFARDDLVQAWNLLWQANWWILALLIPVQFFSYFAGSEIFFTYLRGRGRLQKTSRLDVTAMSLELNFVNHVFPSGGIAGMSYMVWRLGKQGVPAGQATMAQIMRYVVTLGTFICLLALSLIFVTVDSKTSSWIVMIASIVVTGIVFLVIFASYLVGSEHRMKSFAQWLSKSINILVRKITFGRVARDVIPAARAVKFFRDLHEDFIALKSQKKLLIKPIMWSFIFNIVDLSLFLVTFWALGTPVNPAIVLIAYGAASMAGLFVLTPGGAGAYEAIMIGILTAGGVAASTAFAGVILTRTILLLGTICTGFVFYQRALAKYGKPPIDRKTAKPEHVFDKATEILVEETEEENVERSRESSAKNAKAARK